MGLNFKGYMICFVFVPAGSMFPTVHPLRGPPPFSGANAVHDIDLAGFR